MREPAGVGVLWINNIISPLFLFSFPFSFPEAIQRCLATRSIIGNDERCLACDSTHLWGIMRSTDKLKGNVMTTQSGIVELGERKYKIVDVMHINVLFAEYIVNQLEGR